MEAMDDLYLSTEHIELNESRLENGDFVSDPLTNAGDILSLQQPLAPSIMDGGKKHNIVPSKAIEDYTSSQSKGKEL